MSQRNANQFMKVAKEIPYSQTSANLGVNALELISTLPDEEKQAQLEKVEQGDTPTVRELQEIRNLWEFAEKSVAYELELLDYAERLLSDESITRECLIEPRADNEEIKKASTLVLTVM